MADINRGSSNIIDSGNSSTSPLTASSIFTGAWKEVLEFAHMVIQVFASHASAVDGLEIQWSSDGVNIDDTDNFTVPANNGKVYTFGPQARYMRVKYTNGGTTQTSFRLQTLLKQFSQKPSSHRIADMISTDDDAELSKSILTGERLDLVGQFGNVKVTSDGRMLVSQEVTTPSTATSIARTIQSSIATVLDDVYTITNGKTLNLQRLQAGAQTGNNGSKVEIFEDADGLGLTLTLISALYVDGSSSQADLSKSIVGNGSRAIRMRRTPLGGGAREIFARWEGFEI